jgi:hypothetical protein
MHKHEDVSLLDNLLDKWFILIKMIQSRTVDELIPHTMEFGVITKKLSGCTRNIGDDRTMRTYETVK